MEFIIFACFAGLVICLSLPQLAESAELMLKSPHMDNYGPMSAKHTRDGAGLSPELEWDGTPVGTVSMALVCEDPGAKGGIVVHWLAWNLDPSFAGLEEGAGNRPAPTGAVFGRNDFGQVGYSGPNPPQGEEHRYYFHVYALDSRLDLPPDARRRDLMNAMQGRVLARGRMVANYSRS